MVQLVSFKLLLFCKPQQRNIKCLMCAFLSIQLQHLSSTWLCYIDNSCIYDFNIFRKIIICFFIFITFIIYFYNQTYIIRNFGYMNKCAFYIKYFFMKPVSLLCNLDFFLMISLYKIQELLHKFDVVLYSCMILFLPAVGEDIW